MGTEHTIPVAVHVARREAASAVARGRRAMADFGALQEEISRRMLVRFDRGRRLDGPALLSLVAEIRGFMARTTPIATREHHVPATRTRPKGESWEFTSVHGIGSADEVGDVRTLVALRITLDRKRGMIEQDFLGMSVTRHMLERSVERDLVRWSGELREVDEALHRNQGLVAAWRWAIVSRRVPHDLDVHLPFGDGLILGRIRPYMPTDCALRTHFDALGTRCVDADPIDYLVLRDAAGTATTMFEFLGTTTIHEDALRMEQLDFRDAVRAVQERHARTLDTLVDASSWRSRAGGAYPRFPEMHAAITAVADDIAAVANHPRLGQVLRPSRQA